MRLPTIVDTGPLVALLSKNDTHHAWVLEALQSVHEPLHTCEAVLTEAMFLLRHVPGGRAAVLDMVNDGFLVLDFQLKLQIAPVLALVGRYASVPMSLADACLVRMAELAPASCVMTLDRDFEVYRKHGRQVIGVLSPWAMGGL